MKFTLLSAALVMAGYATAVPMVKSSSYSDGYVAPLYAPAETETVSGSYIIMLKNDLSVEQIQDHAEWVSSMVASHAFNTGELLDSSFTAGIKHVYEIPNLKGYAGHFDKKVLDAIRRSEEVRKFSCENKRKIYTCVIRLNSLKKIPLFTLVNYNEVLLGDLLVSLLVIHSHSETIINTTMTKKQLVKASRSM
jgi:hypothetical protein